MEFIQKKTVDGAVEYFLTKASQEEIALAWDRFEGQLPECGFCESGLSCRDCLQGPCISHPFRDQNKLGVCGKGKDTLAVQSLLRLTVKGTMAYLDQLSDFAEGVESGAMEPRDKGQADRTLKEIRGLFENGRPEAIKAFPKSIIDRWEAVGVCPEGIGRDLFKASQKLEGGVTGVEDTLLWAFKTALLGCMALGLQGRLKRSVFGDTIPTELEVNMGVLQKDSANVLLYGHFSPLLQLKIAQAAEKRRVSVTGVCVDPLLPPYGFSPVTNYGSQEVALLTGAVDLVVVGDRFVNPSLVDIAKEWNVKVIPTQDLKKRQDLGSFAEQIVEQAEKAYDIRREIPRDIPEIKESAVMGFSSNNVDVRKILSAIDDGKIKGVAIFAGSNNVKYTQDNEFVSMAREFLKEDILCISEGEASVCLAKYGFLNHQQMKEHCGEGSTGLLSSLGKNIPAVLDWGAMDFLLAIANEGNRELNAYPIIACFSEASRSTEVAQAMWTVAMGVSTYFWPCLPITGSPKTMSALSELCHEKFGSKLHVITEKMEPRAKADLFLRELKEPVSMSGKPW